MKNVIYFILGYVLLFACAGDSFVEKDPVWSRSPFYSKTQADIDHWNAAYLKSMQAATSVSVDSAIAKAISSNNNSWTYVRTWNGMKGDVNATTSGLPEGANLYWTPTRTDGRYYTRLQTDSLFSQLRTESNTSFATIISLQQSQAIIARQQTWIDSVKNIDVSDAFITLNDGAPIVWNTKNGFNAQVTINGTHSLVMNNTSSGKYYTLYVYQNKTGGFDINMPAGSRLPKGFTGVKIPCNHDPGGLTVITVSTKTGISYCNWQYY